jgi:hypothetical protein
MFIHAVLAVWMASSINTNDSRWLEDSDLLDRLRGLECWDVAPYEPAESGKWRKRCMGVTARMIVMGAELMCREDTVAFRRCLFVPVGAWPECDARRMAEVVDGCNVQVLKDIFYMVAGVPTKDDEMDVPASLREKSSRTDAVPIGANEDLSWAPECVVADSDECEAGLCSHFTGLLPVVGRNEAEAER